MKRKVLYLIIFVGIIVGGFSYWFNTPNDMSFLGISIFLLMASGAFLAALILSLRFNEKPYIVALLITLGVLISVMGRIVVDGIMGSSPHNLFPFELAIAFFVSLPSAFVGTYLSKLIKFIRLKISPKTI